MGIHSIKARKKRVHKRLQNKQRVRYSREMLQAFVLAERARNASLKVGRINQ